jgi:hypothetical protein
VAADPVFRIVSQHVSVPFAARSISSDQVSLPPAVVGRTDQLRSTVAGQLCVNQLCVSPGCRVPVNWVLVTARSAAETVCRCSVVYPPNVAWPALASAARPATLRALAKRLAGRFPDVPIQAVAGAVSDAWQAAQLIGVDTVEMVERLARDNLNVLRRRRELLHELGRREPRPDEADHGESDVG